MWVSAVNVVFGSIIVQFDYYNTVNFNLWLLVDSYILLWLFQKWNFVEPTKRLYQSIWVLFSFVWLLETIFLSKLSLGFNSYFRIFYSFIVILLSISTINSLLIKERKPLLKNPMFVICGTFVFFNTIVVLAEAFFASNLQLGDKFRINIDRITVLTGFLCNMVYTITILWMPKKQAFILQY